MDTKQRAEDHREYDDIEPLMTWRRNPDYDTLIVFLPGFKMEQLNVQVISIGMLRISGERPIGNNRWSRFQKDVFISCNYDLKTITAWFDSDTLYIKHPKIISTAPNSEQERKESQLTPPTSEAPQNQNRRQQEQLVAQGTATTDPKTQRMRNEELQDPQNGRENGQAAKASHQLVADVKASVDKAKIKKANVAESAENFFQKADKKEKDQSETYGGHESSKKKSDEGLANNGATTMEKAENLEDAAKANEMAAAAISCKRKVVAKEDQIKQGFGGLVNKLKQQPRKSMIIIVAVLLALAAMLYSRKRE